MPSNRMDILTVRSAVGLQVLLFLVLGSFSVLNPAPFLEQFNYGGIDKNSTNYLNSSSFKVQSGSQGNSSSFPILPSFPSFLFLFPLYLPFLSISTSNHHFSSLGVSIE